MTLAEDMASFVLRARFEDMSRRAVEQLKIRVLDSLGCAVGALDAGLLGALRALTVAAEEHGGSTLFGGGRAALDRAAFYNGALVRYLDFNDSYLAPGETCHPSDNLAAVLAGAEARESSGRDFLTAVAIAYQVQCRLCDAAPVRARGFDHTTLLAYSVAAGVSRALGLDVEQTAHAIAIAGTSTNALRVSRTGALSNWKGLAAPHAAFSATHGALLAAHGVTGPLAVFEGNKGFMDAVTGRRFHIDWAEEDLERVTSTVTKPSNAEIHGQSAIAAALDLRERGVAGPGVKRVDVRVFDVAFHIIGGGDEGEKHVVLTKEQADHSLPYLVAVALLDGRVMPGQFAPARIARDDVQALLRRVRVRPSSILSARFPREVPVVMRALLDDGTVLSSRRLDFDGFITRPPTFDGAVGKMRALASRYDPSVIDGIVDVVADLEHRDIADLTRLLARVGADVLGRQASAPTEVHL